MVRRIRFLLGRFGMDRSGTIALLMGLLIVPIILAVGVFLDYSRSLIARDRVARAIDAAALAVGASADKNLTEAEVKALAQSYFDANYPPAERGWMAPLDVQFDGDTVTISAAGKVDTTLMRIAGIDHVDIAANTEVVRKETTVELVLALDNTGSMSGSKLTALKTASNSLVDILFEDEATSEYVKIALVPFSAAVNVGVDKLDDGWIDLGVGSRSSIHAEDFTGDLTSLLDLYAAMEDTDSNYAWRGCVRARPGDLALNDTPPSPSNPDTLFVPYLAPDEPDTGGYANNYMDDKFGSDDDDDDDDKKDKKDKKDKDKKDKDKDSGGVCEGSDTPNNRQRCTSKYYDADFSGSGGPNYNCVARPILPLTNIKANIKAGITAMVASGNTVIPEGLAWGWRVVSPTLPYTEGVSYDDSKTVKAIVLLTDGDNMVSGGGNRHNKSIYNAFGFAQSGHLGPISGTESENELDNKLAALCENVKEAGIKLYTITFQVTDTTTQNLMRNCASEPDMYHNTTSGADLDNVFEDIAKGLNKLRISK